MNKKPKPWYKRWWGIFLIILTVLFLSLLAALSIYIIDFINSGKINTYKYLNSGYQEQSELRILIEGGGDNWLGNKEAGIIIVEFGDYACPYCRETFPKIRELAKKYDKYIKYIYRDYPVVSEYSANLALGARCAGDQGLFWLMHDKLFINQGLNTEEELFTLAYRIGADMERFRSCYTNNKYFPQIEKDFTDGQTLGISGTPSWFINGQPIGGNIPYEFLEKIIKELIKS